MNGAVPGEKYAVVSGNKAHTVSALRAGVVRSRHSNVVRVPAISSPRFMRYHSARAVGFFAVKKTPPIPVPCSCGSGDRCGACASIVKPPQMAPARKAAQTNTPQVRVFTRHALRGEPSTDSGTRAIQTGNR